MIPIFFAVDTRSHRVAKDLLRRTGSLVDVKFGLEFFIANGPDACWELRDVGSPRRRRKMGLDLKLLDIPTTVGNAVTSALRIEPDFLTVHSCDGPEIIEAAVKSADKATRHRPKILAVTVLTSVPGIDAIQELVIKRTSWAFQAGADGVVCSAHEAPILRERFCDIWPTMYLLVPGIQMNPAEKRDQKRTATARQALEAGASALAIGRDIRDADDPAQAAADILATMQ